MRLLENFGTQPTVKRIAGRLVARVLGDDLEDALATLKGSAASDAEAFDKSVALISALAIETKTAGSIMDSSGVDSIVAAFGNASMSKAATEGLCRTLQRLAKNKQYAQKFRKGGVVECMTKAVTANAGTLCIFGSRRCNWLASWL